MVYYLNKILIIHEMKKMPICPICGEDHSEDEMIGEVCVSCAGIMQDLDSEC